MIRTITLDFGIRNGASDIIIPIFILFAVVAIKTQPLLCDDINVCIGATSIIARIGITSIPFYLSLVMT